MKTVQEVINDIRTYKGYLPVQIYETTDLNEIIKDLEEEGYEADEAAEYLNNSTWVKICSDGVVILSDIHESDFYWKDKHYSVKNDKWTVTDVPDLLKHAY